MADSLDRLFSAVLEARDLSPSASRTSKLFRHGVQKMAKKLVEEAAEIAVGTLISERPPHRTVRAGFPHTAPTLGV